MPAAGIGFHSPLWTPRRLLRRLYRRRDAWGNLPWATPKPDERDFDRLDNGL